MDTCTEQDKKKHLIVLLPVSMANDFELAHSIHWMAFQKNFDVVYMTVAEGSDGSLALSRDMATMKAVTAGNVLATQWIQAGPGDWLGRLREAFQPGDEIVCSAEQAIDHGSLDSAQIVRLVKETTGAELSLISGRSPARDAQKENRAPEFFIWMGFLAIIALFTWLQIRVDAALHGPLSMVIVLTLLCIEFGAIWIWNQRTIS